MSDTALHFAKPPTPAIVAQAGVARLPRWALLLLCVAYVLAGFVGREPWKSADMASFGLMRELALGHTDWWHPTLLGTSAEIPSAVLPYWLGAWAIQLSPSWLAIDFASRIPFGLLLGLTMVATWYGVYYLARRPLAQPVVFAFGGEAKPTDYARSVADGALLALIAMLGLAQLGHETTHSVVQMACAALLFFGLSAWSYHRAIASFAVVLAIFGLALSGTTHWMASALPKRWADWDAWLRTLVWFGWPAWPLALVALLRWRNYWRSLHIALPAVLALGATLASLLSPSQDRALMLALPALAALAAFALPTMHRSVSAIIDWFTLLFFTGCALVIWVVWLAMQTGFPAQPAANVRRLMPGFEPQFSWVLCIVALLASAGWLWLVRWRVARHRQQMWRSLVLPAGGAALCWILLTTLWLPLLDFARSYAPLVRAVVQRIGPQPCVHAYGLTLGQASAFAFHGNMRLSKPDAATQCPWLIVDADATSSLNTAININTWTLRATVRRPSDDNEDVLIFQRNAP